MKKRNFAGGKPCPPQFWRAYDEAHKRLEKTAESQSIVVNYMMMTEIIPMFEDIDSPELQKKLGYQYIGSIIVIGK